MKTDYGSYAVCATITLDEKHLPLLWVTIGEDSSGDRVMSTQLVSYEDNKATVLAERGELLVPCRGDLIMAVAAELDDDEEPVYLYDEEKKDFTMVSDELKQVEDEKTFFSKEELSRRIKIYQCEQSIEEIQIGVNKEERKIAYLGKVSNSYAKALADSGVFAYIITNNSFEDSYYGAVTLRKEYADNKEVVKYFEQLEDCKLDEEIKNEIFTPENEKYFYNDKAKKAPYYDYIYTLPNGTECRAVDMRLLNNLAFEKLSGENNKWDVEDVTEGAGEYFQSIYVERIMRGLLKKPVYTQEELYLYLASIAYDCEIIEIDFEDYSLVDASDGCIASIVENYIENRFYRSVGIYSRGFSKLFFTDELIAGRDKVLETEPYKTINENVILGVIYENDVAAVMVRDSDKTYEFQIELNKAGDKISKITYIDPMASMSEEEKKEYVVKHEVIPAYENYISDVEGYSLVYIDADEIPELITRTASWYNIYTYNNGVVDSGLAPNTFEIIEKENLIHTTEGHGIFYDHIVNIKNGVFESCAEGRYGDVYDAEGNYIPDVYEYYWNGQQVNEDEYNNLLSNAFDSGKAKSMYDIEVYSSIQEAYDNIGN